MKQSNNNAIAKFSLCKVAYAALLTRIRVPGEENKDGGCDFDDWPAALPGLNKAVARTSARIPIMEYLIISLLYWRRAMKRNEEIELVKLTPTRLVGDGRRVRRVFVYLFYCGLFPIGANVDKHPAVTRSYLYAVN